MMNHHRLYPFFIFFLFCGITVNLKAQPSEPFAFAFISDTHINSTKERPSEDLMRTVRDINQNSDIEFVVITGDITEFGSDEELEEAYRIFNRLEKPWHIVPGNHDTNWSESGTNSFGSIFGWERFAFTSHGMLFIGCGSGPNMRMAPGLVPREDIVWLRSILAEVEDDKPVVFLNHYPINSSLANWYLIIDELKKVNIQAILHGHGHRNKAMNYEGIPATMGRSNLRAGDEVGGYNIVSVTKDSMLFSERIPGRNTSKPWRSIELKNHNFSKDTVTYSRPSYSINEKYPDVRVDWSVQDSSDIGTGIVAAEGLAVYANTAGFLVARNIETGEKVWQFKTDGKIYSTPVVSKNSVVFASTDSSIYSVDLFNGTRQWSFKTGKSIVASPSIDNGSVYIGSSEGKFRALSLHNGDLKWTYNDVRGFVSGKPLVDDKHVYFGDWGNYFHALNKRTGKLVWNWTNGSTNRMLSPAAVYPVKSDGKIFITAPDQYITSLDANTGKVVWRSNQHKGRESIGTSADQSLIYTKAMNDSLFAYSASADSMKLKWSLDVGFGYEISPSPISEKDGIIYIPADDGSIYAVDRKKRKVKWVHKISNALVNVIYPLDNGKVLATTMDGRVIKLSYEGF